MKCVNCKSHWNVCTQIKEAKLKSAVDVDIAVTPLAMTRANRPGQPQRPGARVAGNTDPSLQIVIDLDET